MPSFSMPRPDQARCQRCRNLVHHRRIFPVRFKSMAKIDNVPTIVEAMMKVCVKCKGEVEKQK